MHFFKSGPISNAFKMYKVLIFYYFFKTRGNIGLSSACTTIYTGWI